MTIHQTAAIALGAVLLSFPLVARSATVQPEESHAALRKVVGLELEQISLAELCTILSKRTAVPHQPADRETGDLLLTMRGAFALGVLHRAVSDALGVEWQRLETASGGYQARRRRGEAEEVDRVRDEQDRASRAALTQFVQFAELSDEQIQALPPEWSRRLSAPHARQTARLLSSLSSGQQDEVLSGIPLSRPVSSLSPLAQRFIGELTANDRRGPEAAGGTLSIQPGRIQGFTGLRMIEIQVSGAGRTYIMNLPDPVSPAIHQAAAYQLPRSGTDKIPQDVIGLSIKSKATWEVILRDLQRLSGCGVVSDAYRGLDGTDLLPPVPPGNAETASAYLDRMCRLSWKRAWGHADGVLTFRRLDWALQRGRAIPESDLRRWREEAGQSGRLEVADLVQMSTLRPAQLCLLPRLLDLAFGQGVISNRRFLVFWREARRSRRDSDSVTFLVRDLPLRVQPLAAAVVQDTAEVANMGRVRFRVKQAQDALTYVLEAPPTVLGTASVPLQLPANSVKRIRLEELERQRMLKAAETP